MGEAPPSSIRKLGRGATSLVRMLHDRTERRRLVRGLREPGELPSRLKVALLLLGLAVAAAAWGLGRLALAAAAPGAVGSWDLAWGLGGAAFVATVALPVSYDPALLAVRDSGGAVAAVLAASVGITLGALVVFFLGGAVRRKLEKWRAKHALLRRALDAAERVARRWEYLALGVMTAIPFFPDTLPVYLFSLLGLRLAPFLAAVFAGSLVRSVFIVLVAQQLGWLH